MIVDDEVSAIETMSVLLAEHCPEVAIAATFSDPVEALKAIPELQPDLLFLDIEMPLINGMELLRIIGERRTQVVFVTGHEEYAIQALRLHAADYLLKPVEPEALSKAVKRAAEALMSNAIRRPEEELTRKNYLRIPQQEGFRMVYVPDIVRVEADNAYSTLHLRDGYSMIVSKGIREFDQWLPGDEFVRVHRSHLVNLHYLHSFSVLDGGLVVLKNGAEIPVSRRRLKFLKEKLEQWSSKLG